MSGERDSLLNGKDYEQIEILRRLNNWLSYELNEVQKLQAFSHVVEARQTFGDLVRSAGGPEPEDPGRVEDCERMIIQHLKSMRAGLVGTIKRIHILIKREDRSDGGAGSSSVPARTQPAPADPPSQPKQEGPALEIEEEES